MDYRYLGRQSQDESFSQDQAPDNPYSLLEQWLNQAIKAQFFQPSAMVLSTVNAQGCPNSRVLLLKEIVEDQLLFYSNYHSTKAIELNHTPQASALFYWPELEKQIRMQGSVQKIEVSVSEAYFNTRPRDSQVMAWASYQSQNLDSRQALLDKADQIRQQFEGQDIPCPSWWGGYAFLPKNIEFWQGRKNRAHDRVLYDRSKDGWCKKRLSP